MLAFFRVVKFAFQDIVRNASLSLMTVLILVLMLLSVNTLFVIRVITGEATTSIKERIDVSIHFRQNAVDAQIEEIRQFVASFPEVVSLQFFTREEVLGEFKERHKDNIEMIAAVNELEEIPFGPLLVVRTREPKDYEKIIQAISIPEYESVIDAKTFADTERAIDRIHTITSYVEKASVVLSLFFGFIAFLIIFNTIRVTIYTQRTEIVIKRLVGATNWFIRGPYIVEAILLSFLSLIVTGVIVGFTIRALDPSIRGIFEKPDILTDYFTSHILFVVGGELLAVLFLTIMTSMLAMRKLLRT